MYQFISSLFCPFMFEGHFTFDNWDLDWFLKGLRGKMLFVLKPFQIQNNMQDSLFARKVKRLENFLYLDLLCCLASYNCRAI